MRSRRRRGSTDRESDDWSPPNKMRQRMLWLEEELARVKHQLRVSDTLFCVPFSWCRFSVFLWLGENTWGGGVSFVVTLQFSPYSLPLWYCRKRNG